MSQDDDYFIKSIFNKMLNPMCYKNRDGVYLGVNDIFARQIAGLPKEEILGYTLSEITRKIADRFTERPVVKGKTLLEHVEECDDDNTELLRYGGTKTKEYEGICADGIKRTFLVNKTTFNNEKGEIAGLVTVLQDITELNETKKSLKENEERCRIVSKQTGQIVYNYDVKTRKISLSGATRELTGFDLKDFESIDIEVWLSHVYSEERDKVWQAFEKCIEKWRKFPTGVQVQKNG